MAWIAGRGLDFKKSILTNITTDSGAAAKERNSIASGTRVITIPKTSQNYRHTLKPAGISKAMFMNICWHKERNLKLKN